MRYSLNIAFTGVIAVALIVIAIGRVPFQEKKSYPVYAGNTHNVL